MDVRRRASSMFEKAMHLNLDNIERLLRQHARAGGRLLDVGCDDGERTLSFAAAARAEGVVGVEAVEDRAELARARGIDVVTADVGAGFPVDSGTFDAIVSNQVIEHVHDTDLFVSECARALRPGGVAVVSTENLASWHNVAATALGWQPFSLTNVTSRVGGLGNPAALFRGAEHTEPVTWQHVRVFAFRGLVELFEEHGLEVVATRGAGYFPLPARMGLVDPRHAVFLTIAARQNGGPATSARTPR